MNFIRMLSGDAEITQYVHSEGDYVLAAEDLESEGFHVQKKSSIVPHIFDLGSKGARLWTKAPCSGTYYIALQVRDTFGTYDEEYIPVADEECGSFCERVIELSVGGRRIGSFRYGRDDMKYYFFVTEEPVCLTKDEEISYRVLAGDRALFVAVVLMKEQPEPTANAIMNLAAENGEVRFWTTVACRSRLLLDGHVFAEEMYVNNHRFTIPRHLWGVRFIIELQDEEGNILRGRGTCRMKAPEKRENSPVCVSLQYGNKTNTVQPAMSVLPLEEGKLYDSDGIHIYDEYENAYPTQCKVTSRWRDNSLRTVSLQASLPLDGRRFCVKNEPALLPEAADFSAWRDEGGVTVVSGGKTYRFDNNNKSVLPDQTLTAVLYDENGERYTARGGTYEIEEQGVCHIVVKRINRFMCGEKRSMKCLTHLHFYRGFSAYRLEFGFENDIMEKEFCVISGMYLEMEGANGERKEISQLDEATFMENGTEKQGQCNGHFEVNEKALIIEDFWQNYPKSFSLSERGLKIGICPFITQPERYRDEDILLESRLFFYLKTGKYEFHGGLRKYHSIIFGTDAQKLSDIPFLAPDPAILEASGAFGRIKCDCPDFTSYDAYMENSLQLYIEHQKSYREYGLLNYGDSFGEGNIHWTNLEYDFHYGLLIHYLRTGNEHFYQLAKAAVAHYSEVDTCHRSVRFEESGYFFVHTVGHANNYYPHELLPKSYPKIKFHMGHLFTHGLAAFYKMTGIERYKQTVVACADTLARYYTAKFDFLTEREPGWCMLALEAAYEITLDEYYLNACRIIAERVIKKQNKETGCVWYMMDMPPREGVEDREFCYGGKSFMHGVLGSAMKYLYYLTGDERIRKSAIDMARWLAEVMYDDELKEFWYSEPFRLAGKRVSQPETSIEVLDVVLFACLEGKKEYLEIARMAFEKMLESPYRFEYDVAKVFAMRLRFSPEIMYDYAKAREKYLTERGES